MHGAVDAGRVALGAALRGSNAALVDDDIESLADLGRELLGADDLLSLHEALPAALLDLVGHDLEPEIVGAGARYRFVFEGADPIELRLVEPVEQQAKILLGLAGKPDDEGRPDRQLRADHTPGADALQRLLLIAGAAHVL